MLIRSLIIATLCATLTACAQSPMLGAPSLSTASLQAVSPAMAAARSDLGKQTLAGKILTAIALERVTGLKPDPARFSDID